MNRLYLYLWLGGTLVFSLGLLVFETALLLSTTEAEVAYFDEIGRPYHLFVQELPDHPDPAARLEHLEQALGYPTHRVALDAAPVELLAPVLRGEAHVAFETREDGDHIWAVEPDARHAVRFGPLPPYPWSYGPHEAVAMGMTMLLMGILVRLALAPLESAQRAIDATAQRMANGELDARLDTTGHAGVADAVNRMADRLADRLQAQRSLLQAVSHELRTPVSRLRLSAGLVQRVKTDEARARHLASFDAELQALDDLIEELLTFVRMEQVSVDAAPWPLEDALTAIAEDAHLEIADGLPTPPLPRKLFERAVSNLVRNAQRHARQTVRVRATLSKGLCISVDDDGDGIPEADRARVLEPFVHLSPGGHGLGLAISQRIATRSGGSLHLSSSDLGGCRAELRWPLGTSS